MIQGNNEWLLEDLFFAVNGQSNLVIDGILWKLFKFDWTDRKGGTEWGEARARHPPQTLRSTLNQRFNLGVDGGSGVRVRARPPHSPHRNHLTTWDGCGECGGGGARAPVPNLVTTPRRTGSPVYDGRPVSFGVVWRGGRGGSARPLWRYAYVHVRWRCRTEELLDRTSP